MTSEGLGKGSAARSDLDDEIVLRDVALGYELTSEGAAPQKVLRQLRVPGRPPVLRGHDGPPCREASPDSPEKRMAGWPDWRVGKTIKVRALGNQPPSPRSQWEPMGMLFSR